MYEITVESTGYRLFIKGNIFIAMSENRILRRLDVPKPFHLVPFLTEMFIPSRVYTESNFQVDFRFEVREKSVDVNVIAGSEKGLGDEGQEIENVCTVRRELAVAGSNFALFVKIRTKCVRRSER